MTIAVFTKNPTNPGVWVWTVTKQLTRDLS
jgi:hypothetical protein